MGSLPLYGGSFARSYSVSKNKVQPPLQTLPLRQDLLGPKGRKRHPALRKTQPAKKRAEKTIVKIVTLRHCKNSDSEGRRRNLRNLRLLVEFFEGSG